MITIVNRPTETAFSKNPVAYQLRAVDTNNVSYRATGTKAVFDTYADFFNENETITLSWTDATGAQETITFTAKAIPAVDTDIPANEPISIVAQYINAHRFVAPIFSVYYVQGSYQTIIAEVRTIEEGWTIAWTWNMNNEAQQTLVPYSNMSAPVGYHIGYEVFFEMGYNSRKWERIHIGRLFPRDDGGDLYLNISDILDSACRATLRENPFAVYSKVLPTQTDNMRRYYVRFREYADTLTTTWQTENIATIIVGGVMNQVWLAQNWFAFTPSDISRTWLTNRNEIQTVIRGKASWISWFNPFGETVTVRVSVTTIDNVGQSNSFLIDNFQPIVAKDTCLTLPTTPDALGLSTAIRSYSIRIVTTAGQALSTPRYFRVDSAPYRNQRVLAYLNQFGCPETIVCTGESVRQISIQTVQTESVRGVNYSGGVSRSERLFQSFSVTYIYRTGILSASQRESLAELPLSDVLFELTTTGYLALILKAENTAKAETLFDSSETNFAVEWAAQPRINMGAWGADSNLHHIGNLNEPAYSLGRVVNLDGSIDFPTDSGDVAPNDFTELATLEESDLIVFAKLNQRGEVAGFYTYQNGKYKRLIRGLPFTAPSHLDGIGIKTENGDVWIESKDNDGTPSYSLID